MKISDLESKNAINKVLDKPHQLGWLFGFKKLTSEHDAWINQFLNVPRGGGSTLQAHRNSYKTTSGLVAMALLALLYPDLRVLVVRKTIQNAESLITSLIKIFESEIMQFLCYARYQKSSFVTEKWSKAGILLSSKNSISPENSFEPAGVGTSITGRHYDYIWCDDIINMEDRNSAAEREATKSYVRELGNIVTITGSRM